MAHAKHSKLATENIAKLLIQFGLPATIGMLVQALYNIIDTIFIGHSVGALGIAALSIIFPIQMVITAVALVLAVGSGALVSILLGAKEYDQAQSVFGNAICLSISLGLVIAIFGHIFITPLLHAFGARPDIFDYAKEFLVIILWAFPFVMFAMVTNNIVRSMGDPKTAMISMLLSTLVNVILAPIFIFGLGMGMKGAAWATALAQVFVALFLFCYFLRKKSILQYRLSSLILKMRHVRRILAIGSASFARLAAAGTTAVILNHLLGIYGGSIAIATYGILNRIFMFILMPLIGIAQGLQPIIGFNYGAKTYPRVVEAIKLGVKVTTTVSTVSCIVLLIWVGPIVRMFTANLEVIELSQHAIHFIAPTLCLLGFQVLNNNMFEALGKAVQAFFISCLKGTLILIPLLFILPNFWKLNGVWICFPIADILAFTIIFFFFKTQMRKLSKEIINA